MYSESQWYSHRDLGVAQTVAEQLYINGRVSKIIPAGGNYNMPDARYLPLGATWTFIKNGGLTANFRDNVGGTIGSAASTTGVFVICTDNSTQAGTWAVLVFDDIFGIAAT
jgi:hypothetical protein